MRFTFLLRPGWIALILLVGVFSTLCFTLLAPWQFSRHTETQARNTAIKQSLHASSRPLSEVLPPGRAPGPQAEWKRVNFSGHYLPDDEVLAWQRTVLGQPAFEVLTPFRLDNGRTLLVNRGYIRPVQSTRAPDYPAPPTGHVTLTARVRLNEHDAEHRGMFRHDGHLWTYAINSETVQQRIGVELRSGSFSLVGGQPGALEPLPLPQLDSGPYLSYALQWIIFGTMAPLAAVYLVVSEARSSTSPQRPTPSTERYRAAKGAATSPDSGTKPPAGRTKRRKMSVAEAVAEEERREREEAPPAGT